MSNQPHVGYVQVAVETDAPDARARLDEMFGSDVIRVREEPMGRPTPAVVRES